MLRSRAQRLAAASVALLVAAVAAYWGYDAYSNYQTRKLAAALAADTGARLREALEAGMAASSALTADAVASREASYAVVERHYATLKRLDAAALGPLAEALDNYVLTGREILRRVAISSRSRINLAASREALHTHMRADRGRAAWPGEAVRLREKVDQDYREYRLATEALVKLIDSLPATQDRIAGQVDSSLLIEPRIIAATLTHTLEDSRRIGSEIEKLTDLATYR